MRYLIVIIAVVFALEGYTQDFHVTTTGSDGASGTIDSP